jgi:hypothetical protein
MEKKDSSLRERFSLKKFYIPGKTSYSSWSSYMAPYYLTSEMSKERFILFSGILFDLQKPLPIVGSPCSFYM